MVDTVNFKITKNEVEGIEFLSEIPLCLENVGEHYFGGVPYISGNLNGLKVTANSFQVKVKDGSLCKFALGDNYKTMGRKDIQMAIELLSDTLHIPMSKAVVTRLDIAQNIIVKYPVSVYLSHLGLLKHSKRLEEPNGVYYVMNGCRLCFYDKNREQKSRGGQIPELYNGKNVLRYEQRYLNRLSNKLNVCEVTGATLYDESFYMAIIDRWKDTYMAIDKINDTNINFENMKTKQQLYKMGLVALVEKAGGELEMLNQISEAQQRGDLTKKQAYDFRNVIKNACKVNGGLTTINGAIFELDKKIAEAVKFYR